MPTRPPSDSSVPRSRTPLIGRERERADIGALLRRLDVPLVTLTGPGGIGKTRLAFQVATDLAGAFDHGVHVVSLAAVRDAELVLATVAQALGLVALGGQTPLAGLKLFLRDRELLLVLDNFEQVIAAALELADLLSACPGLKLLVTSRETLRIDGEHEFPVPALTLPGRASQITPSDLEQYTAVALFLLRARAVKPDFAITDDNASAIAELCVHLDGLPLAIELAAARIKVLSPRQMLDRLSDRLEILSRDARDVPARLRTMRDAIAWSYELLSSAEQALFRQLSVFAGGCTLEAAEAVSMRNAPTTCPDSACSQPSMLDLLTSLCDKSLLRQIDHQSDGEPRFAMLETIRAYGLEQLQVHREADATYRRLAAWCLARLEPAADMVFRSNQHFWLDLIEAELDNLRVVLEWAIEQGEAEIAQRLVGGTVHFWYFRGHLAEGRAWADRALACGPPPDAERAWTLAMPGWLAYEQGDNQRAIALLEEGLALARLGGESPWMMKLLVASGLALEKQGRFSEAEGNYLDALRIARSLEDRLWEGLSLRGLGLASFEQGDLATAGPYFEQALEAVRAAESTDGEAMMLVSLGRVARANGELSRANRLFAEGLARWWEHRDRVGSATCLRGLASVATQMHQFERAARFFGAAEALRESVGAPPPRYHARYDQQVETLRAGLGKERFNAVWSEGRALSLAEAVEEVLRTADQTDADDHAPSNNRFGLTPSETKVLRLLTLGRSNRTIAESLFISERTAQTHVQHIFGKLGVNSRLEAAAFAREHRLV